MEAPRTLTFERRTAAAIARSAVLTASLSGKSSTRSLSIRRTHSRSTTPSQYGFGRPLLKSISRSSGSSLTRADLFFIVQTLLSQRFACADDPDRGEIAYREGHDQDAATFRHSDDHESVLIE